MPGTRFINACPLIIKCIEEGGEQMDKKKRKQPEPKPEE